MNIKRADFFRKLALLIMDLGGMMQDCKLYLGDCLEVMKKIPDRSIDTVSYTHLLACLHQTFNKIF